MCIKDVLKEKKGIILFKKQLIMIKIRRNFIVVIKMIKIVGTKFVFLKM